VACRVNLYWAHQHYAELARIREQQGPGLVATTPPFLIAAHQRELSERAERGLSGTSKVREIARRVMHGESSEHP
jgi:hypothetical protein